MPSFSDKVFGSKVDQSIIDRFKELGGGGLKEVQVKGVHGEVLIDENYQPLTSIQPTFEEYSLGDKTPFSRMWTAVAITKFRDAEWASYKGEKVEINSNGQVFFHPENDQYQSSVILGSEKQTTTKLLFTVNQLDEESYSPLEPTQPIDDTGAIQHRKQLTKNPFMKPSAGITSVRSKTQGALSALKSTQVDFIVHNQFDFENIFLPYFMSPGSIVCVDYGWSTAVAYDIKTQLEGKDIRLEGLDDFIHNDHLEKNYGITNTVMGNVVNYDSSLNKDGSYECSIEIVSRNAALLDQSIGGDDNIQFLFTNTINDVIANIYAQNAGLASSADTGSYSYEFLSKKLKSSQPVDTSKESKRFISELSNVLKLRDGTVITGVIPPSSIRTGVFHQDMSPNQTPNIKEVRSRVVSSDDDDKAAREMFVDDATLENEKTYISWGLFEDIFLNNFISGVVKTKRKGKTKESKFISDPKNTFDHKFDSRGVFVRYDDLFEDIQTAPLIAGEALYEFLIPDNWDESYNTQKLKQIPDFENKLKNSGVKWYVEDKTKKLGFTKICKGDAKTNTYHPNYSNTSVIPLRDVFISVPLITNAFKTKKSVNDAIIKILDDLNYASNGVWNLKLTSSNSANTGLRVVDVHLVPERDDESKDLIFNITGRTSIVSEAQLKYSTPGDGLASILAIGNAPGPNNFNDLDLTQFAYLRLLNKTEFGKDNVPFRTISLPYQGDPNSLTTEEEANTLDFSGLTDSLSEISGEPTTPSPIAVEKYRFYQESLTKKLKDIEEEDEVDAKTSIFNVKQSDAYSKHVKSIEFVDSYRDYYKKILKKKYFDEENTNTIAPILPIELTLTVYGNTYLNYGDFLSVNYLPEYYKDRVFFMITSVEDVVDVNGWNTTYQTIMRVKPNKKSLITGQKTGQAPNKEKPLALNKKLDPLTNKTSVTKTMGGRLKGELQNIVNAMSTKGQIVNPSIGNEEVLRNSGLSFKVLKYLVDSPTQWVSGLKIVEMEEGKTVFSEMKEVTYDYSKYVKWQQSAYSIDQLAARDNLAYSYAVRDALVGEGTIIDYSKLQKDVSFKWRINEIGYPVDKTLEDNSKIILKFDTPTPGYTDFVEIWIGGRPTAFMRGITGDQRLERGTKVVSQKDFKKQLYGVMKGMTLPLDKKFIDIANSKAGDIKGLNADLTFESDLDDIMLPAPLNGFWAALDTTPKKDNFQDLYVIEVTTGQTVFKYIPIPAVLMKDQNIKPLIKTICERYTYYFNDVLTF